MSKYLRLCQCCHDKPVVYYGYEWFNDEKDYTCGVCGNKLIDLPLTSEEFRQLILKKEVPPEDYDKEVKKLIKLKKKNPTVVNTQVHLQREKEKRASAVICPYCNSDNTKKISTGGRLFSVRAFGLASSKVGKQWHCNRCKSDF